MTSGALLDQPSVLGLLVNHAIFRTDVGSEDDGIRKTGIHSRYIFANRADSVGPEQALRSTEHIHVGVGREFGSEMIAVTCIKQDPSLDDRRKEGADRLLDANGRQSQRVCGHAASPKS